MCRCRSKNADFSLGATIAAIALATILVTPATAQKVAAVDVSFELADRRYVRLLKIGEIDEINTKAAESLARACEKKFRHLAFNLKLGESAEFKLSVVMDTEFRNNPNKGEGGAIRWYFALTRTDPKKSLPSDDFPEREFVLYRSFLGTVNAIPRKEGVIEEIEKFIQDGLPERESAADTPTEDLTRVLHERVLTRMPLFSAKLPEMTHVEGTKLVAVPTSRKSYPGLPDRAEFRVVLKPLHGTTDPLDLRAQLLGQDALNQWRTRHVELQDWIVAEIQACSKVQTSVGPGCTDDKVNGLPTQRCIVVSPLYLLNLTPAPVGEADPGEFELPGS